MGSTTYSWTVGPAESPLVRTLLYVAFGLLTALAALALVVLVTLLAGSLREAGARPTVILFVVVLGVVLLVGRQLFVGVVVFREQWARDWLLRAFADVVRLRWFVPVTLVLGVLLVRWPVLFLAPGVVVAVLSFGVAHLLSSTGELDPATNRLTYKERERATIDLTDMCDVTRVQLGNRTFLWVSFPPHTNQLTQRLYMVPTALVEQIWPAFEAGVSRAETTEPDHPGRRRNVLAALATFGVAGLLALGLLLGDVPINFAVLVGLVVAVVGLIFVEAAIRTS